MTRGCKLTAAALLLGVATLGPGLRASDVSLPFDKAEDLAGWEGEYEHWNIENGALTQSPGVSSSKTGSVFWWPTHRYRDLDLSVEFRVGSSAEPEDVAAGTGLFTAGGGLKIGIVYRAESPTDYRMAQLDVRSAENATAALSPSPRSREKRPSKAVKLPGFKPGEWHTARVVARDSTNEFYLDGQRLLTLNDPGAKPGAIGLSVDRVPVQFRKLHVEGAEVPAEQPFNIPKLPYVVVASDGGSTNYPYVGFPGLVRSKSGDLICVFYAGFKHVPSGPNERLPNGGKICLVRSKDNGKNWSTPQTVYDSPADDHDTRITQLSDGRLVATVCSWPVRGCHKPFLVWSSDDGQTWSPGQELDQPFEGTEVPMAKVVELPDGRLLLPTYGEIRRADGRTGVAIRISSDGGKTWPWNEKRVLMSPEKEGQDKNVYEPFMIRLPERLLLVARQKMWWSESLDGGESWSPFQAMPLRGDAPNLFLTSKNILLCGIRFRGDAQGKNRGTCVIYSKDFGRTWSEPVLLAPVIGAYPGMAELPDGRIFMVYYPDGPRSNIRGLWFRADENGIHVRSEDQE